MKKDVLIALVAIVLVFGIAYGVYSTRPNLPPPPSHPFSTVEGVAGLPVAAPGAPPIGKVIMRVNGEPVTESEFAAAFQTLPQEYQQQFNSEQGKQAFAEQFIRMKLLEQEARKMHLDSDPDVAAQLSAGRTSVLAQAAGTKLAVASPADVRKFYAENQRQMQTAELYHIVIAYRGGAIPPKNGGPPPDEATAVNKALQIYQQLKEGANFAELAKKESDDTASAARGGLLGNVAPGMLPPELDARIMQMKEGEISTAIPSQYGIHIFKMGKHSTRPLDAQLQERIANRVKQQEMVRRVEEMRKAAKVDFDPKFFPDAKNWNAQPPQPGAAPGRPPA